LRAPLDGTVVERNVHVDEMVVDNTVNLFQIADMSRLLVIVNCAEDQLRSLEALSRNERGWTVRPGPGAARGLPGAIEEIGYSIDPHRHTAVIKGYVENPGLRMRAGQYVTATVDIPPPDDVVEIPMDALVDDGKQSLVFVQPDPARHQFTMRRVQVTSRFDRTVYVRATPIPEEEQLTAEEAEEGLLPKEALRPGERVLTPALITGSFAEGVRVAGASESVENRLNALERKLDQILEALGALRRPAAKKSDPHERDAPK
jgi:cobalt-zinc-cadmium efflux system membrane fusion protein